MQEAANAANSGDTIVVKNGASHDLTFTATKSVKVKNETGAAVTVKFNGTDKKFGNGETETFSYTKPSSSSGGSSSGKTTYKVTTSAVNNGGVNASPSSAEKGATSPYPVPGQGLQAGQADRYRRLRQDGLHR